MDRGREDGRQRTVSGGGSAAAGRVLVRTGREALPAIAVICGGIFFLTANDAVAKWLTDSYHPVQILFLRNLLALPAVALLAVTFAGPRVFSTRTPGLHALRGVLSVGGGVTFFYGLSYLPLAEATALVFAAPIFITALSVPLLGERVGWRRWTACIIGFIGVLIIVRPGGEAFQAASLFPVATAVFYSLIMLSARGISGEERIWTLMFYVTLFPFLVTAMAVPFFWTTPDLEHLPHFAAVSLFGTLGMTLISQAFRMAPAATVAPFDYTSLIWASLLGWIFWGEVPGAPIYLGAAVIVASGLYILLRESRRSAR